MGSSVASSVKDGPRAHETSGTSVREYSYRAPSDVSGGSANSYGQHLSSAMLHDIVSKLEQQRLDFERQMENQSREIAELKQELALAKPSLERSEREKDILRKRSEAYRKQVSRLNQKDGSGPSVPLEHYPRPASGCEGEIVLSTEMIANEKKAH